MSNIHQVLHYPPAKERKLHTIFQTHAIIMFQPDLPYHKSRERAIHINNHASCNAHMNPLIKQLKITTFV